ncbi:hypothetical protein LguiA_001724 [Lonicera macranthoides]
MKWVMGDGNNISLWHDKWCGDYKIDDITAVNDSVTVMTVRDILDPNGKDWDISKIDVLIPPTCKADILNIPLPVNSVSMDSPSWSSSTSGKFSIKACYDVITALDGANEDWLWVRKLKIPQKLILFLWTVRHEKNLSNHQRLIRVMNTLGDCKFCGAPETNDHIFRFCIRASTVWHAIPHSLPIYLHDNVDFKTWLDISAKISNNVSFITTLWSLWKARNKKLLLPPMLMII